MIAFFALAACSIMVSVNAHREAQQQKSLGDAGFYSAETAAPSHKHLPAYKPYYTVNIPAALRLRQNHLAEQKTEELLKLLIADVYDSHAIMRTDGKVTGIGAEGILDKYRAPARRDITADFTKKVGNHYVQTVKYFKIYENGRSETIVTDRYWILDHNVYKVALEDAQIKSVNYRQ